MPKEVHFQKLTLLKKDQNQLNSGKFLVINQKLNQPLMEVLMHKFKLSNQDYSNFLMKLENLLSLKWIPFQNQNLIQMMFSFLILVHTFSLGKFFILLY